MIVLIIIVLLFIRSCYNQKSHQTQSGNNNIAFFEQLNQIRDEAGNLLTEIRVKEVRIEEQQALIDSLRKALPRSVRPTKKEIKSFERFTIVTDTVFKTVPVVITDSSIRIEKKDNWLSAIAEVHHDSASFKIRIQDTLTRIETYKKHLLRADEHKILLQASSPYTSINEGFSFTIKQRRPVVTIGPSLNYDALYRRISLGISIQLPIVQIKK